ncbi:hypothetical protein 2200_scaffold2352_00049 [Bacteriophage sp.]|nr:hypothetical protein 2200_scaffold2352_00049 [Bacteriophage sp.]
MERPCNAVFQPLQGSAERRRNYYTRSRRGRSSAGGNTAERTEL